MRRGPFVALLVGGTSTESTLAALRSSEAMVQTAELPPRWWIGTEHKEFIEHADALGLCRGLRQCPLNAWIAQNGIPELALPGTYVACEGGGLFEDSRLARATEDFFHRTWRDRQAALFLHFPEGRFVQGDLARVKAFLTRLPIDGVVVLTSADPPAAVQKSSRSFGRSASSHSEPGATLTSWMNKVVQGIPDAEYDGFEAGRPELVSLAVGPFEDPEVVTIDRLCLSAPSIVRYMDAFVRNGTTADDDLLRATVAFAPALAGALVRAYAGSTRLAARRCALIAAAARDVWIDAWIDGTADALPHVVDLIGHEGHLAQSYFLALLRRREVNGLQARQSTKSNMIEERLAAALEFGLVEERLAALYSLSAAELWTEASGDRAALAIRAGIPPPLEVAWDQPSHLWGISAFPPTPPFVSALARMPITVRAPLDLCTRAERRETLRERMTADFVEAASLALYEAGLEPSHDTSG